MKRALKQLPTKSVPAVTFVCSHCNFQSYATYAAKRHAKVTGHCVSKQFTDEVINDATS
jgi:hypothetical protein